MKSADWNDVRIAVTRPHEQSEDLAAPLRSLGIRVIVAPLVRIVPMPVEGALLEAIRSIATFDWIVFSSVNGVQLFMRALEQEGIARQGITAKIACVGPVTAHAAGQFGLRADLIPDDYSSAALATAMSTAESLDGCRIMLARAGGAAVVLPSELRALGAVVFDTELYRSVANESGAALLRAEITANHIDVVTFTSASAIRYYAELVGGLGKALCAVIGPTTAEAARKRGFVVNIHAEPHTIDGLVAAITRHFN